MSRAPSFHKISFISLMLHSRPYQKKAAIFFPHQQLIIKSNVVNCFFFTLSRSLSEHHTFTCQTRSPTFRHFTGTISSSRSLFISSNPFVEKQNDLSLENDLMMSNASTLTEGWIKYMNKLKRREKTMSPCLLLLSLLLIRRLDDN